MRKKLSNELAKEIMLKIQSDAFQKIIKDIETNDKAADENGTFDVIISTDAKDRSGEIVDQKGWDLKHFKNNPVVLWAHEYQSLPIGTSKETFINSEGQLQARGIFAGTEFAQEVRKLYDAKIIRATSVGFIAKEIEGNKITSSELVEFSFVPVPANPEALALAKEIKFDVGAMMTKGFILNKAVIPNHDPKRAQEGAEWDGTSAITRMRQHFSNDGSGEKEKIEWPEYAKGFNWYNEVEQNDFTSYKLPHHDIVDGEFMTIFDGVKSAMAELNGARGMTDIPEADRQRVYDHIADHYKQFDQEAPALKSVEEIEAESKMVDVTFRYSDGTEETIKLSKESAKQVKIIEKGAVANEMKVDVEDRDIKWNNIDAMDTILWAFYDIYFLNSTPAKNFNKLLNEVADLFKELSSAGTEEKKIENQITKSLKNEKSCKYVRMIKAIKSKAISEEEIGAVMTQLQADIDNLIIVASRQLQSIAAESDKGVKKEKIKSLIKLLNKEIGVVGEKPKDIEPSKAKNKKVETTEGGTKELDDYLELRSVLRAVGNSVNQSLERINKKLKK